MTQGSASVKDYALLNETREVLVSKRDLPLHCPMHQAAAWCAHPKVYLPIEASRDGTYRCPYCGSLYRLKRD
ncbi:MAG: hypothetical protein CR991_04535 [Proteobacteria bacterium]|nr:MAG: hypothetical protein CR991_04535 [Pseudomonadota bacterium]